MASDDVSALILAGGRATRLGGIAKHELVIEGETIFSRQVRVLAPRVAEIIVSIARDGREVSGFRCARDTYDSVGPLGGIAAGLDGARTPWMVVVAGDLPYVTGELVDRVLAARAAVACDAVGVRVCGAPEPLLCALRVEPARAAVARLLAAQNYKASALLGGENLAVTWVDEADPHVVFNVNSPDDVRR